MAEPGDLGAVLARARIVVCTGTGGVGKTTVAAALGVAAARAGRRAMVITVDPARRLAQALGLASLDNDAQLVAGAGRDGGSLHAAMLDPRATFDAMVTRSAHDEAQRDRILGNRFYQNLAGNLSGTHEYMAMQRLHELAATGAYDVIVVDTPPTRDALAFLDAPRLFARLLDNRIYKLLVLPGRGLARTAAAGAQAIVRQLSRVVGTAVIDDAVAFFRSFDGIEEDFRTRANDVYRMLQSADTAFVLVAAPRPDTVAEARLFVEALQRAAMPVRAVVVNRMTPSFGPAAGTAPGRGAAAHALADFRALAGREEAEVTGLTAAAPGAVLVRVPMLAHDVHDLDTLATIADLLTAPAR